MHTSSGNRVIAWGFLASAMLANIAGYLWDLYERFSWFDEILHAYTTFALTLLFALLLYGVVLSGVQTRAILLILTIAALGTGIGALWEIAEWAYDQIIAGNIILGKTDTIIDLIMDSIGALTAGIASVGMIQAKK